MAQATTDRVSFFSAREEWQDDYNAWVSYSFDPCGYSYAEIKDPVDLKYFAPVGIQCTSELDSDDWRIMAQKWLDATYPDEGRVVWNAYSVNYDPTP
jgi:hypothetical protein